MSICRLISQRQSFVGATKWRKSKKKRIPLVRLRDSSSYYLRTTTDWTGRKRIGHLSRTDGDAILRYIIPPRCSCVYITAHAVNWRHAYATVTVRAPVRSIFELHTNWMATPLANGLDADANKDRKKKVSRLDNKTTTKFQRSDVFSKWIRPRSLWNVFPWKKRKKEKQIEEKLRDATRIRYSRLLSPLCSGSFEFVPDCAMESSIEK